MLSARALSSWTAGGGPCANPDITPRSPGLNWPVGSAGWALAAPAHGSFRVLSLSAMPALGPERYEHPPPCRPHILGWVPRA